MTSVRLKTQIATVAWRAPGSADEARWVTGIALPVDGGMGAGLA